MALPLLEARFHELPSRTDFAQGLSRYQLALRLLDEAEATVNRAVEGFTASEAAVFMVVAPPPAASQKNRFEISPVQPVGVVGQVHGMPSRPAPTPSD